MAFSIVFKTLVNARSIEPMDTPNDEDSILALRLLTRRKREKHRYDVSRNPSTHRQDAISAHSFVLDSAAIE